MLLLISNMHYQAITVNSHDHHTCLRPAYPKIRLSVLQIAYVHIFWISPPSPRWIFLADAASCQAPPINQNKKMSKDKFSIMYLVRTVCELHKRTTKTGTLWHSDAFILHTSAKVVLDQRTQNIFSKSNAPCVLLSLMPTCSWTVVVWSELVPLVSCILPPLCQFHAATCHGQLQFQTRHIWRWLTTVKLWMQSRCSLV